MSKVITSPVKRFSGTVVLSDPLTYPQTFAFEDALAAARALGDDVDAKRIYYELLPGILACVEEWNLEGVPAHPTRDTFPSSPTRSAMQLASWLLGEITRLNDEAENVPLA